MELTRIPFNFKPIDEILGGGIEKGVINTVYGEAGSGKSNLALLISIEVIKESKKVIFIDTEASFSPERLEQLSGNSKDFLNNFIIFEPTNFEEQNKIIFSLREKITKEIGLIVIDSLVALYRISFNKENGHEDRNRQLASQLAELLSLSRKNSIPVLVTTQVYSSFNENQVEIVSRDVAKYWSKCLIKLEKGPKNKRVATLMKHRSRPEGISATFFIGEKGLEEGGKGARLF